MRYVLAITLILCGCASGPSSDAYCTERSNDRCVAWTFGTLERHDGIMFKGKH